MKSLTIAAIAAALGLIAGYGVVALEFAADGDYLRYSNLHPRTDIPTQSAEQPIEVQKSDGKTPRLKVIGEAEVDLGSIQQYTEGTEVFKIANEGDAPLKLKLEGTTCKCTVGKMETDTIAPGETAEIELTYKAETTQPQYSHGATIRTNDPTTPKLVLSISGVVERRIYTVPEQVVFTRISANVPNTQEVSIYTIKLPDFEWKDVILDESPVAEFFEIEMRDLEPDELKSEFNVDGGKHLTIRTKPGIPNGPFQQTLRIKTNHQDIVVPISGSVIADVTVVGGRRFNLNTGVYNLGYVEQKEGVSRDLLILVKGPNREKIDVKVASVSPEDVLQAKLGEREVSEKLVKIPLTLTVPPGSRKVNRLGSTAKGFGMVELSTTDPRNKKLRIKVHFAVE